MSRGRGAVRAVLPGINNADANTAKKEKKTLGQKYPATSTPASANYTPRLFFFMKKMSPLSADKNEKKDKVTKPLFIFTYL